MKTVTVKSTDNEIINRISAAMNATWQAIAPDAAEFCEDNEEAMEMCIDAGRMRVYGDDLEAAQLVEDLCQARGYTKVLTFLSRHFNFL